MHSIFLWLLLKFTDRKKLKAKKKYLIWNAFSDYFDIAIAIYQNKTPLMHTWKFQCHENHATHRYLTYIKMELQLCYHQQQTLISFSEWNDPFLLSLVLTRSSHFRKSTYTQWQNENNGNDWWINHNRCHKFDVSRNNNVSKVVQWSQIYWVNER